MGEVVKVPRRAILSDDVYEQLKSLIMDSSIEPGKRMNTLELSRRLDVSPTPVREALARLESDGLVVKSPLKGYSTSDLLDGRQVRELYELRLMLEVPSARRAAERLSVEEEAALRWELNNAGDVPEEGHYDAYRALTEHDSRFHHLILTVAGNDMISQAMDRTHCHLHIFRLTYQHRLGQRTLLEHGHIVEAIRSRDGTAAGQAMRAHLEQSRDRVLEIITG